MGKLPNSKQGRKSLIVGGWAAGERLLDDDRDELDQLRDLVDIEQVAAALCVQLHAHGLTCPHPDHEQTGCSAPASVFVGRDGVQRWRCHRCDIGGDVFEYVILAGFAENFPQAIELVRDLASELPEAPPLPRYRREPEDPDRLIRVRTDDGIAECERYCVSRGWDVDGEVMPMFAPHRWDFMSGDGYWLRIYADDERSWWQEKPLDGQPPGTWRSPAGRDPECFTWEPWYVVTTTRVETWFDHKRLTNHRRKIRKTYDCTPDVPPLVLLTEGASDFITAVVAQKYLPIGERFAVVGIPGAGNTQLLNQRPDWAVIMDNDFAGDRARERIDAEQEHPVRHLYVPDEFKDLSDWWASVAVDPDQEAPWLRRAAVDAARRNWACHLREQLDPLPRPCEEDSQ